MNRVFVRLAQSSSARLFPRSSQQLTKYPPLACGVLVQSTGRRAFASAPPPIPPPQSESGAAAAVPTPRAAETAPGDANILLGEPAVPPIAPGSISGATSIENQQPVPAESSADVVQAATEAAVGVATGAGESSATWGDMFVSPAISFITSIHDATGLPWWGALAVATLTVRTLILPVSIYTMRNSSKMSAVQDDLKVMREDIMQAVRAGNRDLAQKKQQEQRDFMRAAGVSPANVLLGPLIQFPVFISFFVGIRKIAERNPDLATGGVGWFVDLSSKDATFGLPLLAGMSLMAMTELGGDTGAKMTPQMRMVMRGMAALSIPMTSWLPAAVFCYWIPNNIFSVCLAGAMRSPTLKERLGLSVTPEAIPGTRAAKQAERSKENLSTAAQFNPSEAAASYMKKRVSRPSAATVEGAKPVLLKTKPRKGKRQKDGSNEVAA